MKGSKTGPLTHEVGITDALTGRFPRRRFSQRGTIAPSVNALAGRFLLARRASGRTISTVQWYEARLRRLANFLEDPRADAIAADDVRRFLVAVKTGTAGRAAMDTYVEGHRKAIAALFTWAVREGVLARSPVAGIPKFRGERRLPTVLSPDDVRALIEAQPPRTREGTRNRAMLALLYDTGIRVGELVAARLDDIDQERAELRVRGKSRRERIVPLSVPVRTLLGSYLHRVRPPELFAASDRLFLGRTGRPLTTNAVRLMLRRAKSRAGVLGRVHPHAFRSSFLTQYMRNGGDPFTAQAITGIRSAQVMAGYINMALSDVHARHATASPIEGMLRRGA